MTMKGSTMAKVTPSSVTSVANETDLSVLSPEEAIKKAIFAKMGVPPGFLYMRVSPLWHTHYRVNIFTEIPNPIAVVKENKISDSFFITLDKDNNIINSDPAVPANKY